MQTEMVNLMDGSDPHGQTYIRPILLQSACQLIPVSAYLSIQTLETFIQTQRVLLARQRADIERLMGLKAQLSLRPGDMLQELTREVRRAPALFSSSIQHMKWC